MNKVIFYGFVLIVLLSTPALAFSQTKSNRTMEDQGYSLIGKKGLLTFPEMKAEVTYISDTSLHWKVTLNNGEILQENEKLFYQRLSTHLHFLNWIEKSGLTVSQIIDTKNCTVKAFWSFKDDKSENGQRSSKFIDAKFEFIK